MEQKILKGDIPFPSIKEQKSFEFYHPDSAQMKKTDRQQHYMTKQKGHLRLNKTVAIHVNTMQQTIQYKIFFPCKI